MLCPFCGKDKDRVIDSRATDGGKAIRRRRQCLACDRRFTTYENVEQTTRLVVIKSDESRVPFDREKILRGLQKACYKRPVPAEQLAKVVDDVEEELFRKYDREVASLEIGKLLAEHLRKIDHVAYVRFASVYKKFGDVGDFIEEVRDLLQSSDGPESPDQQRLF